MMSSIDPTSNCLQQLVHAAGFQLEHADRFAAVAEIESRCVVERDRREVEISARVCSDQIAPHLAMTVSVFRPRKSIFSMPSSVERHHRVLASRLRRPCRGTAGCIRQGPIADDHAGRVDARVPASGLPGRARGARVGECRLVFERRFKFGDFSRRAFASVMFSSLGIIFARRSASPYSSSPCTRPRRAPLLAPRVPKVMICETQRSPYFCRTYSMTSPRRFHAEVDVDIRRADTLGIQKAFEDQAETQRIDIGDAQHIGDQRAGGRATARARPGCRAVFAQWMKSQTIRK